MDIDAEMANDERVADELDERVADELDERTAHVKSVATGV